MGKCPGDEGKAGNWEFRAAVRRRTGNERDSWGEDVPRDRGDAYHLKLREAVKGSAAGGARPW